MEQSWKSRASWAFLQESTEPAMLSMTQSTESREKKEIWGKQGHIQGWDLGRGYLCRGWDHPSHTVMPAWHELHGQFPPFLGACARTGHLPPRGHQTLTPTTKVNGRFQDTTPTTPENASWGQSGHRLSLARGRHMSEPLTTGCAQPCKKTATQKREERPAFASAPSVYRRGPRNLPPPPPPARTVHPTHREPSPRWAGPLDALGGGDRGGHHAEGDHQDAQEHLG